MEPVIPPVRPPGLVALVDGHACDAELAALLWIMLEARTPVVVAGQPGSGRRALRDALAGALPPAAALHPVGALDAFDWLPEAAMLGWRAGAATSAVATPAMAGPATGVFVVDGLADEVSGGPGGDRARLLVRALALGYGMLATMRGDSLEQVLDQLHSPTVATTDDERSRLGVVLLVARPDDERGPRITAAHYVRPTALDTHGHVQRLPPAVLATWVERTDRWDHFAWGVLADLAGRTGRTPRDLEREQARRAAALLQQRP